ncbi:MAG: hypothetical protein ACXADS_05870 [Candidatus Thorarchaeota archaeon]
MSLLGPEDFGKGRKGRLKKHAKDLSPEVRREIDKWLDELDESEALKKISSLVGPEEARRLLRNRRGRKT